MNNSAPRVDAAARAACTFLAWNSRSTSSSEGDESSRFIPTAPVSMIWAIVSDICSKPSAYPLSISAVTGTSTASTIFLVMKSSSSNGICSPSLYPRQFATPALVVAIAGNPTLPNIFALTTSQALGNARMRGPLCNSRKVCALSLYVIYTRPLRYVCELQSTHLFGLLTDELHLRGSLFNWTSQCA